MRAPVAVHLDIRPRLTLPAEPRARARSRWRLPPLAVPAVGYWLAMGALTYGFTRLGPNPLDGALPPAAEPPPATAPAVEPHDAFEPAPSLPPPAAEPAVPVAEAAPPVEAERAPAPLARDEREHETENRDNRKAGRREEVLGSRRDEPEAPAARKEEPRVAMSFPEFTDSSRPKARERAADGPRIDSLFERADERPAKDVAPDSTAPPESAPAPVAVSSCEAAIARNNEQLTIGAARGPADITREAYASILQNGRYLAACSIPDRTVFEVCAAVKDGRAVGITITSSPPTPALNACVRNAVARLKFPQNSRLDVTHTRFDAVKR
jgi:hypothetical protein